MWESLFGSKSSATILLFVFVNGKCYPTQVSSLLNQSLTPLQKACQKLEKVGVLISLFEGKTKIYQFNPAFPLLKELQELLKKAFILLSPAEKKGYYFAKETIQDNKMHILVTAWEKLKKIKQLTVISKSYLGEESGRNLQGKGEVTQECQEGVILFHEKGVWRGRNHEEISFSNGFRFTIDRSHCLLSIEHIRRGVENPVFIFHLAPSGKQKLTSIDSHFCTPDAYFGQMSYDENTLKLSWRVIGPRKNEEIDYYYS